MPANGIDRTLFLKVRMAYLQTMLAEGATIERAIDAINIHDEGQGRLLSGTPLDFDDGTVTTEIIALVKMLTGANRRRVHGALLREW